MRENLTGKLVRDIGLVVLNVFLNVQIWLNRIENFKIRMFIEGFDFAKGTKCIVYSVFLIGIFILLTYLWMKEMKEDMEYSRAENGVLLLIRVVIWVVLLITALICLGKSFGFLGVMCLVMIGIYMCANTYR